MESFIQQNAHIPGDHQQFSIKTLPSNWARAETGRADRGVLYRGGFPWDSTDRVNKVTPVSLGSPLSIFNQNFNPKKGGKSPILLPSFFFSLIRVEPAQSDLFRKITYLFRGAKITPKFSQFYFSNSGRAGSTQNRKIEMSRQ